MKFSSAFITSLLLCVGVAAYGSSTSSSSSSSSSHQQSSTFSISSSSSLLRQGSEGHASSSSSGKTNKKTLDIHTPLGPVDLIWLQVSEWGNKLRLSFAKQYLAISEDLKNQKKPIYLGVRTLECFGSSVLETRYDAHRAPLWCNEREVSIKIDGRDCIFVKEPYCPGDDGWTLRAWYTSQQGTNGPFLIARAPCSKELSYCWKIYELPPHTHLQHLAAIGWVDGKDTLSSDRCRFFHQDVRVPVMTCWQECTKNGDLYKVIANQFDFGAGGATRLCGISRSFFRSIPAYLQHAALRCAALRHTRLMTSDQIQLSHVKKVLTLKAAAARERVAKRKEEAANAATYDLHAWIEKEYTAARKPSSSSYTPSYSSYKHTWYGALLASAGASKR